MIVISRINEIISSGVPPLEIRYHSVISCQFGTPCALRSELLVNSPDVGVIKDQQYLPVTLRNNQCVEMFLWGVEHIAKQIKENSQTKAEWISIYAPVRLLTKSKSSAKLEKLFSSIDFNECQRICLEFPQELLYEELAEIESELKKLRKMGFKIAVAGYGNEMCPTIRLAGIKPDIVVLDEYVTACINKEEMEQVYHIIEYSNHCGSQVVLSGVADSEMADRAFSLNCMAVIGKISGKSKKSIVVKVN